MRGTALVTRDNITLAKITKIPSGRAIAAEFRGMWMININAPSGAARRQERERFYNSDMPQLLRTAPANIILGGD
jgi:exonuclease III